MLSSRFSGIAAASCFSFFTLRRLLEPPAPSIPPAPYSRDIRVQDAESQPHSRTAAEPQHSKEQSGGGAARSAAGHAPPPTRVPCGRRPVPSPPRAHCAKRAGQLFEGYDSLDGIHFSRFLDDCEAAFTA